MATEGEQAGAALPVPPADPPQDAEMKETDDGAPAAADGAATEQPAGAAFTPASNPMAKRKIAMFLAYVGHGYQGMQRNPGCKTIEEELFRAIHKAGGISDANADDAGFTKIHWMRAARTDKGVSAVGQVVSFKMILEPPGIVDRINAALPPQIRIFGFTRATNGFDTRKHCDKRRYEYILPEWAFDPARCLGRSATAAAAEEGSAAAGAAAPEQAQAGEAAAAAPEQQQQQQQQQQGQGQEQDAKQEQQQQAGDAGAAEEAAAAAAAAAPSTDVLMSPAEAEAAVDAAMAEAAAAKQPEELAVGGGDDDASADPVALAAAEEADEAAQAAAAFLAEQADGLAGQRGQQQQPAANGSGKEAAAEGPAAAAAAAAAGALEEGQAEAGEGQGSGFVFDQAQVDKLNRILRAYEGTHNFHNFTIRKPASAPDVKRYILSFKCEGTFEINGQRWVRLVVVGQSFMLHQIRKMVGMAVAVARGTATLEQLRLAMKTSYGLNVPMAPELGLFLDKCYYDAYNEQWASQLPKPLDLEDYKEEAAAFKMQHLYPHIAARDAEETVNATWLRSVNEAAYRFSEWSTQVSNVRKGGGRRPAPRPGTGVAATVGSYERYGQKRKDGGGGAAAGGGAKAGRGGGDASAHSAAARKAHASLAAEYSD